MIRRLKVHIQGSGKKKKVQIKVYMRENTQIAEEKAKVNNS